MGFAKRETHEVVQSFLLLMSEMGTRLDEQGVGVGRETLWVHLGVEPIGGRYWMCSRP